MAIQRKKAPPNPRYDDSSIDLVWHKLIYLSYLQEASSIKFVTICHPGWDRERQDDDDDEDDEGEEKEEEEKEVEDECGGPKCYCGKPLEKNPTWPWRLTRVGFNLLKKLNQELMNRDPEMHDMYFYNDFAGYGVQEVFENWVGEPSSPVR